MLNAVIVATFANLFRLVVVMGLGVMLVVESEFRIGNPVRRRADVGADASRVGLERQHVEVAHHLHVLAAFVALRNLDLDGRRIGGVAFAGADAGLLQAASFWRNSMAAMRRSTERTLSRYSSSFCWSDAGNVRRRSLAPPRTRSSMLRSRELSGDDSRAAAALFLFVEQAIEHVAWIDLGGDRLRRGAKAAVRIVPLVQPFLVFLPRLRHRGQFQRRQRR